jgi:hypothetical protein
VVTETRANRPVPAEDDEEVGEGVLQEDVLDPGDEEEAPGLTHSAAV